MFKIVVPNQITNHSFAYICVLFYEAFMNVLSKVRAVERMYRDLEKDVQKFRNHSKINCVANCVKCCTTSRIETTALEFYPLAYHLYKTGKAEEILEKIEQDSSSLCPVLNTLSTEETRPGCMFYEQRGLICRLFGDGYSVDKYGVKRLTTCRILKDEFPAMIENANKIIQTNIVGIKSSDYYSKLQAIDFNEAHRLYPIKEAIRIAIETIVTNFYYKGNKAM